MNNGKIRVDLIKKFILELHKKYTHLPRRNLGKESAMLNFKIHKKAWDEFINKHNKLQ